MKAVSEDEVIALVTRWEAERDEARNTGKPPLGWTQEKTGYRSRLIPPPEPIRWSIVETPDDARLRDLRLRAQHLYRERNPYPEMTVQSLINEYRAYADSVYATYDLPIGDTSYLHDQSRPLSDWSSWFGAKTEAANAIRKAENWDGQCCASALVKYWQNGPLPDALKAAAALHSATELLESVSLREPPDMVWIIAYAVGMEGKRQVLWELTAKLRATMIDDNPDTAMTLSQAVLVGTQSSRQRSEMRAKSVETKRRETEKYRDAAKAILSETEDRNLTPNKCAALVIQRLGIIGDQSAVSKAIKELFQKRTNGREYRPLDRWIK